MSKPTKSQLAARAELKTMLIEAADLAVERACIRMELVGGYSSPFDQLIDALQDLKKKYLNQDTDLH